MPPFIHIESSLSERIIKHGGIAFHDYTEPYGCEAAAANWTPHLFFLGVMAGKELPTSAAAFKNKIFIAFPTLPGRPQQ